MGAGAGGGRVRTQPFRWCCDNQFAADKHTRLTFCQTIEPLFQNHMPENAEKPAEIPFSPPPRPHRCLTLAWGASVGVYFCRNFSGGGTVLPTSSRRR